MYGLIGYPLGHSFSARFFNEKFKREGIKEEYNLFPLPSIAELPRLLKEYPGLKGLNVTIPYKETVIPFLNELSLEAREIGAVNVIKISGDADNKSLKGFNSDCYGFKESLPSFISSRDKALILGTGGASKAVAYALRLLNISYDFVSRKPDRNILGYAELTPEIFSSYDIIINTTPLGMFPHVEECPPLPYDLIDERYFCYDLVYNPEETLFLKKAKSRGAKTQNGLKMLHLQAVKAWEIWNDK